MNSGFARELSRASARRSRSSAERRRGGVRRGFFIRYADHSGCRRLFPFGSADNPSFTLKKGRKKPREPERPGPFYWDGDGKDQKPPMPPMPPMAAAAAPPSSFSGSSAMSAWVVSIRPATEDAF